MNWATVLQPNIGAYGFVCSAIHKKSGIKVAEQFKKVFKTGPDKKMHLWILHCSFSSFFHLDPF
jgi:hypothetical protein